jgi:NAD+ kinase
MPTIKKVAVVSRVAKERHRALSEKVISVLSEKYNLSVYLNDFFAEEMNFPNKTPMNRLSDFDLIIALGGDGTILWTARYADEAPIFGVNAGHLGFLTTATLSYCEECFDRIMNNDFILERCMRLEIALDGKLLPTALNEVYVTNKENAKICALDITVEGFNLGTHMLDGLLVSTPVGSTAYALSAGGSIIEPKIKAMQIVPVNSVMRRIRPFVVPGEFTIAISAPERFEKNVVAVIDGIEEGSFKEDSVLKVTKAKKETVFLRFPDFGFFHRLKEKLGFDSVYDR